MVATRTIRQVDAHPERGHGQRHQHPYRDRDAGEDAWAIVDALDARHTLNAQALFSGDVFMSGLMKSMK